MYPDTSYNTYAYQYGHAASELPTEAPSTERCASFQEMPGSFPPEGVYELDEQSGVGTLQSLYSTANNSFVQGAPDHLQTYHKTNEGSIFRRPAVIPNNTLRLPRLEVPPSTNSVPRLMGDSHSLTPSPISPATPQLDRNTTGYQYQSSKSYYDSISPCENSSAIQTYTHLHAPGCYNVHSPATSLMTTSVGSSNATTPLSANPSSAGGSLDFSTQTQSMYKPFTYSQAHIPPTYDSGTNYVNQTQDQTALWQNNMKDQQNYQYGSFPTPSVQPQISSRPAIPEQYSQLLHQCLSGNEKEQGNAYAKSSTKHPYSEPEPHEFEYSDIPPAYCPVVSDPRLCTSPQTRYAPVICQHCGKVYTGKYGPGNLKRHVRQTHESVLERVINKCLICMKVYNRADALRKHSWKKHRRADAKPNKRRR